MPGAALGATPILALFEVRPGGMGTGPAQRQPTLTFFYGCFLSFASTIPTGRGVIESAMSTQPPPIA